MNYLKKHVIIDLKIDSNINRLCEKVVDYYDTCTIRVSLELSKGQVL